MYFPASASVARQYPELALAVERIDALLAKLSSTGHFRPHDFAAYLGVDRIQADSIFRLLAEEGMLQPEAVLVCPGCETQHPLAYVEQVLSEEEDLECSWCSQELPLDAPRQTIFELTAPCSLPPASVVEEGTAGVDPPPDLDHSIFRLQGDYWEIRFARQTVHLKEMVGLFYLSRLFVEQGRDVLAVELLAARGQVSVGATEGSAGELLDSEAIQQYRARHQELAEELEIARTNQDLGRISQLEGERHELSQALTSALGLGGRVRQKTDNERVRKSVSNAIAKAIQRIEREHPLLGRHLENAITCGMRVRYAPAESVDWILA